MLVIEQHNLLIYGRCNHRCKICMARDLINKATPVTFGGIKEKIQLIRRAGYAKITFAGSEPTLYKDLFRAMSYARSIGLRCIISSNGSRFSSLGYARKFMAYGPVVFKIPFHSHKAAIFEDVTQVKGSFAKVARGIDNICNLLSCDKEGSYLTIDIPIGRHNFHDLPDIVRFLHRWNIKSINFFHLTLKGNLYGHPEMIIDLASLRPYLARAVALAKRFKISYSLGRLPICLLESEAGNFTLPFVGEDYIKLTPCQACQYDRHCGGLSRLSLIARYGKELLGAKDIFPGDLYEHFFSQRDLNFIKKL